MDKIKKFGYAQVEPNRLSAQKTRQVFAQLPLADDVDMAENGMALVYDLTTGTVRFPKEAGEHAELHMSAINLPDDNSQLDTDFVLVNNDENPFQAKTTMYPRVYGLTVGDTFPTNAVMIDHAHVSAAVPQGTKFTSGKEGYWIPLDTATVTDPSIVLQVVKDYTMPDGQRGIKFTVASVGGKA